MADLGTSCSTCRNEFDAVFDPATGTRQLEIIAGDLVTTEQCFVRDEIRFINNGRLIFGPRTDREREQKEYFDEYFVICRKIVVVGGHQPGQLPCAPDSPGTMYNANNVITWQDRLKTAADGPPPNPPDAGDGQSFGGWSSSNNPNGNDGATGGKGSDGIQLHNDGGNGMKAPRFTLICTEIEVGLGDHLSIDFNGQNGGEGGHGQSGGKGGKGMAGRIGESDTTWPGTGCDRQPGNGGDGGEGGAGGPGGSGGKGGDAGDLTVLTTTENITTGPFGNGRITYVNDGGYGGKGGRQGLGGAGGVAGQPGFSTSECSNALPGEQGDRGIPASLADAAANPGSTGARGAAGHLKLDVLTSGACADRIPLEPVIDASGLQPASYCRGFATAATKDGSITGQHLSQITSATTSLAGVTATVKASSTDTQLDLRFQMSATSATGTGNLVLHRTFGPDVTLNNAMTVNKFDVTAIAPATGARGNTVNVSITGQCFDASALTQHVIVSGLGVSVLNVVISDPTTILCTFDISALATLSARDVTVVIGTSSRSLVNAFTVTA